MPTQTAIQPAIPLRTFQSSPAVTSPPGARRTLTLSPTLPHASVTTGLGAQTGSHLNAAPQPQTQRWLYRAGCTWWRIFGAVTMIVVLVLTVTTLLPTFWGINYRRRSYELAQWEAAKDYIEACSNQKVSVFESLIIIKRSLSLSIDQN